MRNQAKPNFLSIELSPCPSVARRVYIHACAAQAHAPAGLHFDVARLGLSIGTIAPMQLTGRESGGRMDATHQQEPNLKQR